MNTLLLSSLLPNTSNSSPENKPGIKDRDKSAKIAISRFIIQRIPCKILGPAFNLRQLFYIPPDKIKQLRIAEKRNQYTHNVIMKEGLLVAGLNNPMLSPVSFTCSRFTVNNLHKIYQAIRHIKGPLRDLKLCFIGSNLKQEINTPSAQLFKHIFLSQPSLKHFYLYLPYFNFKKNMFNALKFATGLENLKLVLPQNHIGNEEFAFLLKGISKLKKLKKLFLDLNFNQIDDKGIGSLPLYGKKLSHLHSLKFDMSHNRIQDTNHFLSKLSDFLVELTELQFLKITITDIYYPGDNPHRGDEINPAVFRNFITKLTTLKHLKKFKLILDNKVFNDSTLIILADMFKAFHLKVFSFDFSKEDPPGISGSTFAYFTKKLQDLSDIEEINLDFFDAEQLTEQSVENIKNSMEKLTKLKKIHCHFSHCPKNFSQALLILLKQYAKARDISLMLLPLITPPDSAAESNQADNDSLSALSASSEESALSGSSEESLLTENMG